MYTHLPAHYKQNGKVVHLRFIKNWVNLEELGDFSFLTKCSKMISLMYPMSG